VTRALLTETESLVLRRAELGESKPDLNATAIDAVAKTSTTRFQPAAVDEPRESCGADFENDCSARHVGAAVLLEAEEPQGGAAVCGPTFQSAEAPPGGTALRAEAAHDRVTQLRRDAAKGSTS
jgi:hypothetical protein